MFKANIQGRTFRVSDDDNDFFIDDKTLDIDILEYKEGKFHILLENRSYSAEVISVNKETKVCEIKVGKSVIAVQLKDKYDDLLTEIGIDAVAGKKVNDIKAPMPGMVLHVMVENGQTIKKGDSIVVLEAMKMENILKAPADVVVKKIVAKKGNAVEKNQVLVTFE